MNGNNVCARLRLVSMCVFPKAVSDNLCVFESVVQDAREDKQRRRRNQCQHDRKEKSTRRLRTKTQCVKRRPARCAENAQEMVPEEAMRRKSEPESKPDRRDNDREMKDWTMTEQTWTDEWERKNKQTVKTTMADRAMTVAGQLTTGEGQTAMTRRAAETGNR